MYRWEGNIRMHLKEHYGMGWHKLDLSVSGLGQVAHSFQHSNISLDSIKCREFVFVIVSFSMRTLLHWVGHSHYKDHNMLWHHTSKFNIWDSHSSTGEHSDLLGYDTAATGKWLPTFIEEIATSIFRVYNVHFCHIPKDFSLHFKITLSLDVILTKPFSY